MRRGAFLRSIWGLFDWCEILILILRAGGGLGAVVDRRYEIRLRSSIFEIVIIFGPFH